MNNPDHILSLETNFWVRILKFFDAEPGFGMKKNRIWDGKIRISDPGSATLVVRTLRFYRIRNKAPRAGKATRIS